MYWGALHSNAFKPHLSGDGDHANDGLLGQWWCWRRWWQLTRTKTTRMIKMLVIMITYTGGAWFLSKWPPSTTLWLRGRHTAHQEDDRSIWRRRRRRRRVASHHRRRRRYLSGSCKQVCDVIPTPATPLTTLHGLKPVQYYPSRPIQLSSITTISDNATNHILLFTIWDHSEQNKTITP